jgi:hypothetical protein
LRGRREDELADRAACPDQASHETSMLDRDLSADGAEQDGGAAGARARDANETHDQDEHYAGCCERNCRKGERKADCTDRYDARRAVAVGKRSGDRLRGAECELAERDRKADRRHADSGCGVDRRQEKTERRARRHRDRE